MNTLQIENTDNADRTCFDCGYDLRATPSLRCSECGRDHTEEDFTGRTPYQRSVDRLSLRCLIAAPAGFACMAAIGFGIGMFFQEEVVIGIVGASAFVATIAALVTSFIAAIANLQLDLVGRAKPNAWSAHPIRFTIALPAYAFIMYSAQVMVAIVLASAGCLLALLVLGAVSFLFDLNL